MNKFVPPVVGIVAGLSVFVIGNTSLYPAILLVWVILGLITSIGTVVLSKKNRLASVSTAGLSMWISLVIANTHQLSSNEIVKFILTSGTVTVFTFISAFATALILNSRNKNLN
jgi:hypothetical protein